MLKQFLSIALLTILPSACAYSKDTEFLGVDEKNAIPIEVVEKTWKCPGCSDNEKYVLAELQENTKI